jgi:hypothetical protein
MAAHSHLPGAPDHEELVLARGNAIDVRWFAWRQVQEALDHGRDGGIALHHFRYDLRRFGLRLGDPACHILSADRSRLVAFAAHFGMPEFLIKPPRPHRPEVWHFDAFGTMLERLKATYPPPEDLDDAGRVV